MLTHTTRNVFRNSMPLLTNFFSHTAQNSTLNRNPTETISKYCSQRPEQSQYDKTVVNPFFYTTLSKPIPQWFLAIAKPSYNFFLQCLNILLEKWSLKLILQKLTMKVNHFLLGFLYSNAISLRFNFLTYLNRFGLDHIKYLINYLMLPMNIIYKLALHFTFIETTYFPNIRKNLFCTLIHVTSCTSQTQPNMTFQNQLNMQTVTHLLLILMNPYLMKTHHKVILPRLNCQNPYNHPRNHSRTPQVFSQIKIRKTK